MKIIIESTDIDSFKDVITTFYHAFNTPAMKSIEAGSGHIVVGANLAKETPEAVAEEPEEETPPVKIKKRPGKKPRNYELPEKIEPSELAAQELDQDDTKKPEAESITIDPPETSKAAPAISKEAVFAALKKVSSTKGMIEARALLDRFQSSRISELKEEQYQPFIQACERLAASG